MPQGKTKIKATLPVNAKTKRNNMKGPTVTKRGNCPVVPKKLKHVECQKLKRTISKTVNQAMEDELRARALDGKKSLLSKSEAAAGGSRDSRSKREKAKK